VIGVIQDPKCAKCGEDLSRGLRSYQSLVVAGRCYHPECYGPPQSVEEYLREIREILLYIDAMITPVGIRR
jgi:hypothetical protein